MNCAAHSNELSPEFASRVLRDVPMAKHTSWHAGGPARSQLAQTSRKSFKLAQRLTATLADALRTFWDGHEGGVVPFLFYNLAEGPYDATGAATLGRYTVVFRGNWLQTTSMQRTDVPQIELVEVA